MTSVLLLGLLIGMQHALEVDHVTAVASLATRARSVGQIIRHGAVWGVGHSLTLLLLGGLVIVFGAAIPDPVAAGMELLVGVMLVALGFDVLRRLLRDRVHFHSHRHGDGKVHMHAHSHAGETGPHDADAHDHSHPQRLPLRTLLVGMMHGLAGSAALLILALGAVQSPTMALVYILMFGVGSVIGMAALSAVIALPLSVGAGLLTWAHRGLHGAIGGVTILVDGHVIYSVATTWPTGT